MAMDFFEYQEAARKRTGQLVVLYVLAVIAIIVLVYIAVAIFVQVYQFQNADREATEFSLWSPDLLWKVGGGTLLIVGLATVIKIAELRSGGSVVAAALGGRLINVGTRDADERKVLNVVEEMAIASGTPCPSVYLLEQEPRINAFAAGYASEQSVIGVTRGCAENLSRDELQGVVAHEFSHILNGDMRLNIKLIGILHGILAIGLAGGYLARVGFYSGGGRSSRRGGGGGAAIVILGLALMVIGYVGTFFGNLIKAAVSRQREFLADASAVSFTRNPHGIADALKKIGGTSGKARLRSPKAAEYSHMYFGSGLRHSFLQMLATHPPLDERIRRIEPRWDGSYPETITSDRLVKPRQGPRLEKEREPKQREPKQGGAFDAMRDVMVAGAILDSKPASNAVDQVGRPSADHLDYAIALMARLPDKLKEAVHEARTARAIVYALLLDEDHAVRTRQWKRLESHAHPITYEQTRVLLPLVEQVGEESRLPLLDLALPALRTLTAEEYATFRGNIEQLIVADGRVEPFEWLLRKVLLLYLDPHHTATAKKSVQYYNLNGVRNECVALLSGLAYLGNDDEGAAILAFRKGAARLGMREARILAAEQVDIVSVDRALDKIALLTPRYKKVVLQACAACISADKEITVREGELFRGIADVLDCPMPPLLPGQKLA